jgi:hypothetical protein
MTDSPTTTHPQAGTPDPDKGACGKLRRATRVPMALSLLLAMAGAAAMQSGATPEGAPYLSGGASHEELRALHERRHAFNLWVITAAAKSGSHLAEVLVTIRDERNKTVFNRRLDGPWLLIALPLGRYDVEAALDGQVRTRATTLHKGDLHQVFFYFDTGDKVGEDNTSPFPANPYDGPAKRP